MVTLSKITKDDAKDAAMMFLGILAMWTDCFFDEKAGARLLNISVNNYEGGNVHYDGSIEALESYIESSNLSDSVFVRKIEEIYDFSQTGIESKYEGGYHIEDLLIEFGSFRNMFDSKPFLSFKDSGVNMLKVGSMMDDLLAITGAADARYKLLEEGSLTLDEISLLAGVGIKTVRNAVSSKSHDRLITAGRIGDKTAVDANEAYRWLLTKKGFTGPFLYTEEPPYESYETLSQFRHHCFVLRKLEKLDVSDLANKMGWNTDLKEAYINFEDLTMTESLEFLTPKVLLELAKFYQSKNINTFVVEGSKILASVLAEYRAKSLFN